MVLFSIFICLFSNQIKKYWKTKKVQFGLPWRRARGDGGDQHFTLFFTLPLSPLFFPSLPFDSINCAKNGKLRDLRQWKRVPQGGSKKKTVSLQVLSFLSNNLKLYFWSKKNGEGTYQFYKMKLIHYFFIAKEMKVVFLLLVFGFVDGGFPFELA